MTFFILGSIDLLAGIILLFSKPNFPSSIFGIIMIIKGIYSIATDIVYLMHKED
jgi:uncharacterized membrane protein HdeD (DUF308 family)